MACELVDVVTATPTGPITVMVGDVVPITGEYSILGGSGSGGVGCTYGMNFEHLSPGLPTSFVLPENPAAPATPYTKNWTAVLPLGTHTLRVSITHLDPNVPAAYVTPSNTITVTVTPRVTEEQGPSAVGVEEHGPTVVTTEEQAPSAAATEEQAPAVASTEESAPASTATEES